MWHSQVNVIHIFLDTGFADRLLQASKSLYTFAKNNRGKYTDCVTQAKDFYG